jgi:hypothetical protein
MTRKSLWTIAGFCGLLLFAIPSTAQTSEVKEKPPMYSYIANWQIPRAHWADMAKGTEANYTILSKALSDGTIVGYGNDEVLVHDAEGETHDNWWSAMSMAGLIKVLDMFYASPSSTSDVLSSSTKHWDEVMVSRYYNWHPGSYKGAYAHIGQYKLKADAPDDAVDTLSKSLVVPVLEKLLADGTIIEYEVDTMAIHTEAPGNFYIVYVSPKPEGLDKVQAAVQEAVKASPLSGPAFGSMTDLSGHRDGLVKGDGTFK